MNQKVSRGLSTFAGLLVAMVWLFPIYWMVITAFKPGAEQQSIRPYFFPVHPTLANFRVVVDDPVFWRALRNSAIVAAGTVTFAVVVALLAAFAVCRFRFGGRKPFLLAILLVQLVPLPAIVIPVFLTLSAYRLADTLTGLVISYLVFALPFGVWTLRGFVDGIPVELEEAAMVDGCSRLTAFRKVVLPLLAPGLIATAIYTTILAWNEFLLAYFLISSTDEQTLPLWLTHFTLSEGVRYGPLMAGSTLITLPVVVLFMAVQRQITGGLTAGAVKG